MAPIQVLILSKEPVIALHIADTLLNMGHAHVHVTTVSGAIAAAANQRPTLMIIDLWLSSETEIVAMIEHLRADYITHIYLSISPSDGPVRDHRAFVVSKPFSEYALIEVITEAIGASLGAASIKFTSADLVPANRMVKKRGRANGLSKQIALSIPH